TLMGKARSMRLACQAPPNLWDEFIMTANYLTIQTTTHSLMHTTLYELWFVHKPDISHLQVNGSWAFVLIQN
ncbi:hypothetical protein SERLADRAFT_347674, partial [Serpula lacrymans var. lacrymans S7.9]